MPDKIQIYGNFLLSFSTVDFSEFPQFISVGPLTRPATVADDINTAIRSGCQILTQWRPCSQPYERAFVVQRRFRSSFSRFQNSIASQ